VGEQKLQPINPKKEENYEKATHKSTNHFHFPASA